MVDIEISNILIFIELQYMQQYENDRVRSKWRKSNGDGGWTFLIKGEAKIDTLLW